MCKCKPDYEADYCVDCAPIFLDRAKYNRLLAENEQLKAVIKEMGMK